MSLLLCKATRIILPIAPTRACVASAIPATAFRSARLSTNNSPPENISKVANVNVKIAPEMNSAQVQKKKTMTELDEELRAKLEAMSGDGGASGVEYENGQAEGLKRGVKSNMFRVI